MNNLINVFLESIWLEINTFPCLGLVSKENSGSHDDMDYHIFYKSYEIFEPYLNDITNNLSNINEFKDLQKIGLKYEKLMFQKTRNINTHKGLIFAVGIFYFALLKSDSNKNSVINFIKKFCQPLKEQFNSNNSYGTVFTKKYNIKSARQTALDGYKVIFDIYDFYKNNIQHLLIDDNYKYFYLIIFITTIIDDTNIIKKIGFESFLKIKINFKNKLNNLISSPNYKNEVSELNDYAISNNISPGGSADMFVLVSVLIKLNF